MAGGVATQSVTVRDACRMAIDGNVAQRQGCLLQIDSSTQRRVATYCTSAVLDGQVLHQLCLLGGLVCVREGEPRQGYVEMGLVVQSCLVRGKRQAVQCGVHMQ